jgi:hypothetical protein
MRKAISRSLPFGKKKVATQRLCKSSRVCGQYAFRVPPPSLPQGLELSSLTRFRSPRSRITPSSFLLKASPHRNMVMTFRPTSSDRRRSSASVGAT